MTELEKSRNFQVLEKVSKVVTGFTFLRIID